MKVREVVEAWVFIGVLILLPTIFPSDAKEIYKWVDEKGTVHFSENPPSIVSNREKGPPKENGIETLKRSENRPQGMVSDGKNIRIFGIPQSSGST
jgi:hypothetical protein